MNADNPSTKKMRAFFPRLMEIAGLLTSSLDTRTVLRQATEAACEVVDAEGASLFLIDPNSGQLFFEIACGPAGEKIEKLRLEKGEGIVGRAIQEGQTVISNDAVKDPTHSLRIDEESGLVTRNVICSPLTVKGRTIGALEAINKKEGADFFKGDRVVMEMLANQVAIAVENSRLYDQLRDSFEQTLLSLIVTIEKRDPYTGGHTQRVYAGCVEIAKQMEIVPDRMDHLRMGALLHDIGKIGILDSVLRHPGPLSEEQWRIMRTHPTTGVEILQHITGLAHISPIVLHHHERWDGLGYPDELNGKKIPLEARIIAVADAYDAMTSNRPYRDCMGHEAAVQDIRSLAGTQFDPTVVNAFLKAVSDGAFPLNVD